MSHQSAERTARQSEDRYGAWRADDPIDLRTAIKEARHAANYGLGKNRMFAEMTKTASRTLVDVDLGEFRGMRHDCVVFDEYVRVAEFFAPRPDVLILCGTGLE